MLHITDLTLRHIADDRILVDRLTCHLGPGDRAVIIGEEGNGKSTVLRVIAAAAGVAPAPDYVDVRGAITLESGLVAYLPQHLPDADRTKSIYTFMCDGPGIDPWDTAGWHTAAVDLGLDSARLFGAQTMETLSGGERIKVQLARLRITEPDLWLLDEPSNDLDLETLAWLEEWLRTRREPVVLISHDELLIRRAATVIIHLESIWRKTEARHTVARVPYDRYLDERERGFMKQDQLAKSEADAYRAKKERYEQIRSKVEHAQNTVRRGDPHGGRMLKKKMAAVQSLGRRMDKEYAERTQKSDSEDAILAFFPPTQGLPSGKEILDISWPTLEVDDRILARNLMLRMLGPEKIALIGPNGSGKTTLLRRIAEVLEPRPDLSVGVMPQDYAERMDPALDIEAWLVPSGNYELLQMARDHLGSMKFTRREMERPIGELSGGQTAKLFILRMILEKRNVLILDEPTRNFSPLSGPVIRGILAAFDGAVIAVSHDRMFLGEVPDRILRLTPDGLSPVDPETFRDDARGGASV